MIVDRPLTLGEIFDRAVTLVVRRFPTVLIIGAATAVPVVLSGVLEYFAGGHPSSGARLGSAVLRLISNLLILVTYGGFALLFAQGDDGPSGLTLIGIAFSRFWRFFRVSFATGIVTVGIVAGGLIAVMTFAWAGPIGVGIAGAAVGAALLLPLFASQQAFYIAILEDVDAWRAVSLAFSRVLQRGQRKRSWVLGFFIAVIYIAPFLVFGGVAQFLTAFPWAVTILEAVFTVVALALLTATMTIAALDYRVRTQGTDLLLAAEIAAVE